MFPRIILGSQSPRREEILRFFSVPFIRASSDFDESSVIFSGNPIEYTTTLATKKGQILAESSYPQDPILTADTVVFFSGTVYNKPSSREEAFSFLQTLSGQWHSVFTAVVLSHLGKQQALVEETRILFDSVSSSQIDHYLDHINFLDKAGGYAIQQCGGILVKKIEGCYYNVMGLPLTPLKKLLHGIGIDLWSHLKLL